MNEVCNEESVNEVCNEENVIVSVIVSVIVIGDDGKSSINNCL